MWEREDSEMGVEASCRREIMGERGMEMLEVRERLRSSVAVMLDSVV
jgi:hypothetical protein